jgi:dolichol-phosphate mannosyltransferase
VGDKPARLVVICPIYNEEQNIAYFFERIKKALEQLDPLAYAYQLLFTNNRSMDGSLAQIDKIRAAHDWVGYLTMSRNHGYQLSVLAGLSTIRADLYMICDVDCEDPPEMVHDFLNAIERGYDLAYGIRNNRDEPWLLSQCRSAFYVALRALGDYRIVPYMAEFAMFKRCVRDVVIGSHNSAPFLRAEYGYAGFNLIGIAYRRDARRYGKTHYNLLGNVGFAVAGILAATTFPLRAVFYAFPLVCLVSLLLVLLFGAGWFAGDATMVGLLFVNGLYMAGALAFVSIYLARTYQNGVGRRRFIVDRAQSALPRSEGSAHRVAPATGPGVLEVECDRR